MSLAKGRAARHEAGEFFGNFQGELFGFLLNMGLSSTDADDVLNDSLTAAWQYWDKIRDGNPRAYLYKVARNQISGLRRRRARKPEHLLGDTPTAAAAGPGVITMDFAQQVVERETMRWALQKLTVREREAVLFRHVVGCDLAETAAAMEISTGTVKRYTSDGLKKLHSALNGGKSSAARKEEKR
jgi:RNA polymerase sigma factor (sigma-70 family)